MNNYQVGDNILFRREGLTDTIGLVYEKLPGACFVRIASPQYSVPMEMMVRNHQIIKVMESN